MECSECSSLYTGKFSDSHKGHHHNSQNRYAIGKNVNSLKASANFRCLIEDKQQKNYNMIQKFGFKWYYAVAFGILMCLRCLPVWIQTWASSREAAVIRKKGIKHKHHKFKRQTKKLVFAFIRTRENRLCSSCLGPTTTLYGTQPVSVTLHTSEFCYVRNEADGIFSSNKIILEETVRSTRKKVF